MGNKSRVSSRRLIAVVVLGFILRLISINQSLWLDEATTALVSQRSVSDYITNFAPGDFHPPLYYLFSIFVAKIFGTSEFTLRSISLIAGVVTIYFVHRITMLVSMNKRSGIMAGLFLATSGLHIYYSQEARMYALAALFATMSVYYFLKENWKLFGASILAMVLTHYVAIFLLPIYWIYGYISRKDKKWWKQFFFSYLFLIIGFGLWSPVFYQQLTRGLGVETTTPLWWNILGKTTPKEIALVPAKFIFGRITIDNDFLYMLTTGVVGIIFGLIVAFAAPLSKKKVDFNDKRVVVWLWLLLPTTLTAIMGLWVPVFSYFRVLFVLPALYILLGLGIEKIRKPLQTIAILFVVLVNTTSASMYLFNSRFHREDWKGLVEYISKSSVGFSNSQVVFPADSQMEAYNYYFTRQRNKMKACGASLFMDCNKVLIPASTIDSVTSDTPVVWLMRYVQPIFDPEDNVRKEIDSLGYKKTSEHDFNGIVVWKYENSN